MRSSAASGRIDSDAAKIAVAATDRRARGRVVHALAAQPGLSVRSVGSAQELLGCDGAYDLLVAHCQGLGSDELALFAELERTSPGLLIVAVCEDVDCASARRAIDAGLDGLVFAAQLGSTLAHTVAAVLVGQTVVPSSLQSSIRKPALSVREKQVLAMVVMGLTNREIAARLFLAESTVKSHLSSAFGKLGVRSRSEAVAVILDPRGSLGIGILAITGPSADHLRAA